MTNKTDCSSCTLEWSYAHFILRTWVGLRLLWAGLDKMRQKSGDGFGLEYIQKSMEPIVKTMEESALLPKSGISLYASVLPWALLIVGAWALLGLATRTALFAAGLVFVSLSVGLMALPDDDQVVMRGVEVALTALALITAGSNALSLDALLFRKKNNA
jgi:thiosulfate dehydrogenase (quinone) large subunit